MFALEKEGLLEGLNWQQVYRLAVFVLEINYFNYLPCLLGYYLPCLQCLWPCLFPSMGHFNYLC